MRLYCYRPSSVVCRSLKMAEGRYPYMSTVDILKTTTDKTGADVDGVYIGATCSGEYD